MMKQMLLLIVAFILLCYTCSALGESTLPDRSAYIQNPALFTPVWENEWQPEDWMLSFDDKVAALCATDPDHLFTIAHRGDIVNYPENSIEGIISTWAMGGDCVEIDVRFTKDGVAVLMHDETLERTTNFQEMRGKNGLPNNKYLFQWTYDQLCQLNLKEGLGGKNAAVTPYKIPTLEEALTVCKDRLFVILDKPERWRYCDIEGIMVNSAEQFIYPYMEATGNYSSVLICFGTTDTKTATGTLTAEQALQIQQYIYEKSGEKVYFYLRGWTSNGTASSYAQAFCDQSLTNSAILINGAFDPLQPNKIKQVEQTINLYPNTMFGGWTLDDFTDYRAVWEQMYDVGLRGIMTNNMPALVRFAAEKK